tara:strand:+ start:882 stop:2327 length:1446 start_codon:yes stop_codon:yes gene_type:complete
MSADQSQPQDAPTHWRGILKHLGPGLIVTACIVGSGELIATPKVGADHGFSLLWFIIIGCIIKVFVQVELGRAAMVQGKTTLELMDSVPGPRFIVSWLIWCFVLMFIGVFFQLGGIVGGVGQVFAEGGINLSDRALAVFVALATAAILASGKYQHVERFSIVMVVLFVISTGYALYALQAMPAMEAYRITGDNIREGLSFKLPDNFGTAFAAFGMIGVGATELIYYPNWCLEKGYSRNVGPREDSEAWYTRARGWLKVMRIDAWVSMVIYTSATVVFYLLGAALLRDTGVSDKGMILDLSNLFKPLGSSGWTIFLVGAFIVLFSTLVSGSASNARLLADTLVLYKLKPRPETDAERIRLVRGCCIFIPCTCAVLYVLVGAPVSMVLVGGVAQAIMLAPLAGAALWFRYKMTDRPLQPGLTWTVLLWVSALAMAAVGLYMAQDKIRKQFKPKPAVEKKASLEGNCFAKQPGFYQAPRPKTNL